MKIAVTGGTMKIPLASIAQVRILSEGVVAPYEPCGAIPMDLQALRPFTDEQIAKGLPEPESFGLSDLNCCKQR